jgi:hypothetical protein
VAVLRLTLPVTHDPPLRPAPLPGVSFALDLIPASDAAPASIDYTPLAGCDPCLPSFLHGPITFEPAAAPMFVAKVAQALHEAEEEDGDDAEEDEGERQHAGTSSTIGPTSVPVLTAAETPARPATATTPLHPAAMVDEPLEDAAPAAASAAPDASRLVPAPVVSLSQQRPYPPSAASSARVLRSSAKSSRRRSVGASASATHRVTPDGLIFRRCVRVGGGAQDSMLT